MAQALLVNVDIEAGAAVLRALDAANIKVKVALWAYLEEYYSDWRLIIASPDLDNAGYLEGYGLMRKATDAAGIPVHKRPDLLLMSMKEPFIRDIRRQYRKLKDLEGVRPGGMFGDRFLSDGYVYRIA
jgi:hypothetical protein